MTSHFYEKNIGGIVKILPVRPNPDLSGEGGLDFLRFGLEVTDVSLSEYCHSELVSESKHSKMNSK